MSNPEATMVSRLKADNAVKALIVARVYPIMLPQKAVLPAICYEVPDDTALTTAGGTDGTSKADITVHSMAATYLGAKTLARAVSACLTGSADTYGNIWHKTGESDDQGDVGPGEDVLEAYIVTQDYTVWHS